MSDQKSVIRDGRTKRRLWTISVSEPGGYGFAASFKDKSKWLQVIHEIVKTHESPHVLNDSFHHAQDIIWEQTAI